jgi:hypothetical protein
MSETAGNDRIEDVGPLQSKWESPQSPTPNAER